MSHLGVLVDRLREAAKVYAGNNRLGAGKSLGAVINYFDEMGLPQDLGAPLFALLAALNDLENGKQPDMLKASSPPHRPPDEIVPQLVMAQAAAAMQLLTDAGDSNEVAARAVARADKWGGENHPAWTEIVGWREKLMGAPGGDLAKAAFAAMSNDYKVLGRDPRHDAEALLTGSPFAPE